MSVTGEKLTRAAGLAAVAAGLLYIIIQPIHPVEEVAAVTSTAWAVVASMTVAFAILALVGITGIYLRQVEEAGVLGLLGYGMFGLFFLLPISYSFAEALIIPQLADDAPEYVEGFLAVFNGATSDAEIGALVGIGAVSFLLYVVGGAMFGVALLRARVLPRWAAATLLFAALATPLTAVLPHSIGRYAAVPMGLALIGLGYSLWSEDRSAEASIPDATTRRLDLAAAE